MEGPTNPRQPLSKSPVGWWFPGTLVFIVGWALRAIVTSNSPSPIDALKGAFSGGNAGGQWWLGDLAYQAGAMAMLVGPAMVLIAYFAMLRD
jgi:hypothetical protein